MAADENVATLRRLIEAVNQGSLVSVASEVIAPGFVRHDLAGTWPGVQGEGGVVDLIGMLRAALPDMQFDIDDIFGVGDRVALRFTLRGTIARSCSGGNQPGRRSPCPG